MKAVALTAPGEVKVLQIPEPIPQDEDILLKVELVGLCGSDLNSYRGMNPLVSYTTCTPRGKRN
jgi:threonine dehydrogenase-like Zn-dependent dehydrogenase